MEVYAGRGQAAPGLLGCSLILYGAIDWYFQAASQSSSYFGCIYSSSFYPEGGPKTG